MMHLIILTALALLASAQEDTRKVVDVIPAPPGVRESVVTQLVRVRSDNTEMLGVKMFRSRDNSDKYEHENDDLDFQSPHYRINAFDEELVLKLDKQSDHVAPAYTATFSFSNTSTNHLSQRHGLQNCFYQGTVAGKPGSTVSVSICNAMRGVVRTNSHMYEIAPTGDAGTHIIHRRSISDVHSAPCAVNDKRHKRSYRSTFLNDAEALGRQIRKKRSEEVSIVNAQSEEKFEEEVEQLSRNKRSFTARQHFVETMIVADRTMAEHHGSDLEHYILTVAMVANQVFSHSSLGNAVALSVIKIMVVDDDSAGLRVSTNAARTLHDFCTWQRAYNSPDDTDPNHYDLAILMTRKDLCGDSCDTLGMAEVGSMCSGRHSCAVVEEDGLSASYTVAHEVGHVMNMMHDDNPLCRANFAHMNPDSHIMSSTMNQIDSDQPWSRCSRQAITNFLESGRGSCLYDKPQNPKVYPTKLPGAMYSIDAQCEMAFGPGSRECTFMTECGRLWCHTPNERQQCHTRHFPRADGSPCGRGLHCFQGKCTSADEVRTPQDGQWGKWSEFGSCSRTCSGGVQMSSRECNNPKPKNGGSFCTGTRLRFRSCNTKQCPVRTRSDGSSYEPDYRAEQCAQYNGHPFPQLGIFKPTNWIPKYSNVHSDDKCKLLCQSTQTGTYVTVSERVVDGTRCGPDTTDVCVQGHCMKAGCDGVLGSSATYDKCGVCSGGNNNCKRVRGSYNKKLQGYHDVIVIPKGAASIDILQRGYRNKMHDGNYLALKNEEDQYILNGGLTLSTIKKDVDFNGNIIRYTGVGNTNERIVSSRPIKKALTVQVLSLTVGSSGKINPPRIKYSYYIPQSSSARSRKKNVVTVRHASENRVIKLTKSRGNKPAVVNKLQPVPPTINGEPLPPDAGSNNKRWVTGRWTKCRPKFGCTGTKTRKVTCKDERGQATTGCESRVKPYEKLPCHVMACSASKRTSSSKLRKNRRKPVTVNKQIEPMWDVGSWGACSKLCGPGRKVRYVTCRNKLNKMRIGGEHCAPKTKPPSATMCIVKACKH